MRSILTVTLLLCAVWAYGWTFKVVQAPMEPDKQAYLRKVKKSRQYYWYLIIPNDAGFQVHLVENFTDHKDHIHIDSNVYGALVLNVIENPEDDESPNFFFDSCGPSDEDPFAAF